MLRNLLSGKEPAGKPDSGRRPLRKESWDTLTHRLFVSKQTGDGLTLISEARDECRRAATAQGSVLPSIEATATSRLHTMTGDASNPENQGLLRPPPTPKDAGFVDFRRRIAFIFLFLSR